MDPGSCDTSRRCDFIYNPGVHSQFKITASLKFLVSSQAAKLIPKHSLLSMSIGTKLKPSLVNQNQSV